MSRLVVISNRVAPVDEGQTNVGGLAVAVQAALEKTGGIWFGWSGEKTRKRQHGPNLTERDRLTFATVDLTERDLREYYEGFSNGALWPLLHYRLDLAQFNRRDYLGYMRVNDWLARMVARLLEPDDLIWIHDYHLFALARTLRRIGVRNRIGFFLHTPFPPRELFVALPWHAELLEALSACDLVGFQTDADLQAFRDCLQAADDFEILEDGAIRAFGGTVRAAAFPIGLDARNVRKLAARHNRSRTLRRLKSALGDRRMIVSVDRLDYSKGLADRFRSYAMLLDVYGELDGKVSFMQVAPPSRTNVHGYSEIRGELENLAGSINGRFADFDWAPLRYLNRSFSRDILTCFYRAADVGLVTPLRDGMNLVAKEYVASQDPENPGVLVLSKFAGAAAQMTDALLVNPYDHDEVANTLYRALRLPLSERRRRWQKLMDGLMANDVHRWQEEFVDALAGNGGPESGSSGS